MVHVLAVVHQPECPIGKLGAIWTDLDCRVTVVEAWHQPVPESAEPADALVVMGGVQGCLDDDVWPWLPAMRDLIRSTVSRGTPFLGVCLGHQLAAVAFGGRVERSDHLTLGLTSVALSEEGSKDPLVGGLGGREVIHFNNDVSTRLPPDATLLATDPTGQPQAVRFAERARGLRFHPEAGTNIFNRWLGLSSGAGEQEHTPWDAAVAAAQDVKDVESQLDDIAADIGRRFVGLVAASSQSRVA